MYNTWKQKKNKSSLLLGLNPECSRDRWVSNPLSHNGTTSRETPFLALHKNEERMQQSKNFKPNLCETAELLPYWRKTRMRLYREARREAIEWIDYRRIYYIAASGFHPFSRVIGGKTSKSSTHPYLKQLWVNKVRPVLCRNPPSNISLPAS